MRLKSPDSDFFTLHDRHVKQDSGRAPKARRRLSAVRKIEFLELMKVRRNVFLTAFSVAFVAAAMVMFDIMGRYADSIAAPGLEDWFHNIIPLTNANLLASAGYLSIMAVLAAVLVFSEPDKVAFALVTIGLFVIVRSLLFSMTHLGAPATRIDDSAFFGFDNQYFKQDLFPSGHVAVPYLGFLVFAGKWSRTIMMLFSVLMGFVVLLMHTHYSIDVFGAYFVAFGVFHFGKKYFWERLELRR